jgi:osmoprotectant transport system permease protein
MYPSIKSRAVEVICAYTSDGRIEAYDLVVLEDPRQAFPPYDAILLVSARAANRPGFRAALEPLVGAINLDLMRKANMRVDVEGQRPRKAGSELLQQIRSRKGDV